MRHPRPWSAFFLAVLSLAASATASGQTTSGDFSLSSGAVYQTAGLDAANAVAVDTISLGGPYIYATGDNGSAGATVKLSSAGVALTSAPFINGGTGVGQGVAVDPAGNIWVAGYSVTGGGTVANWVVQKYDPTLVILGTSVITGIALGAPIATSIAFDASGNAFVAGYSSNTGTGTDFRVMKYSPSLVVLASTTLGGASIDQAKALALDSSGNVIVTGDRDSGVYDWWTVKLSSSLVMLSSAIYDGGGTDRAYAVTTDPSGNIYVTGESSNDVKTIKYNASLGQTGSVGYNSGAYDAGFGSMFVGASTLVVVGTSMGGATEDWLIFEYDTSLALISSRTYDGGGSDRAHAVAKGTGTYMYVAGWSLAGASLAYRTLRMNVTGASAGPLPPGAPSGLSGTVLSSTTIRWSWTDNSSDETGFRVKVAGNNLSGDLAANTTTWLQTGLTANVSTGSFNVDAFNAAGTAGSLISTIYYTMTDPPNSLSATFFGSSVAFTWPTMTNPANTRWSVERGTDGVSYASQLYYSSAAAAFTDIGLAAQTTYYYRIRSANGDGVYSFHANAAAIVYTGGAGYPGCTATNNVGSGQFYATIQSAVNALPSSLAGPSCVVIRDGATYAEQVTVRNFTNNGYTLSIFADPASGLTPIVAPPAASTAAFQIANASVSMRGVNIVPANWIPYGIFVSSAYVLVSSVNVQDAGGKIATAGVTASSWTTVSYTSVTVGGANATGIWLPGSTMTRVSYSTAAANGTNAFAMRLTGASANTITETLLVNLPGAGAYLLNSNSNVISRSSIACDNGTGSNAALDLTNSSSNSVTGSFFRNWFADGIRLNSGSNYNTIIQSTSVLRGAGGQAAIDFTGSHYNTVNGCLLTASGGLGINFGTSNFNAVSQTTMAVTNGTGRQALLFNVASSNTVTQCYIANPNETGVDIWNGSSYNSVDQSTIIGGPSSNLYPSGVHITNGSYNAITQSRILNSGGYGAIFDSWAIRNTISLSTITSGAAGHPGLYFMSGSGTNTVSGSYVQGSTGVYVVGAKGVIIESNVLAGGPLGAGVFLDAGSSGAISLSSNIVTGARYGLVIATQPAVLSISSTNFSGLATGATAVHFLGGTFIATITAASFDASVAVSVNAAPMDAASRVTMRAYSGARAGAAYENDPNSLVDWFIAPPPTAPSGFAGAAQTTTSILWTWTDNSTDESGFRIMAGASNVSGNLAANATSWLQPGLGVNTSSGSLLVQVFNATGTANSGALTLFSLAAVPTGLAASSVFQSSATVTWTAGNPAGTLFELERSTGGAFVLVNASSLAVAYTNTGLTFGSTHYYRVRALNGDGIATAYASTLTIVTLPPSLPNAPLTFAGTAQSTGSILWSWLDNSLDEQGFRIMAGATNVSGDLAADATTWLQAGLGVNTSSGPLLVQVFNATGTTNSGALTRYTWAAAPSGLAATGVFKTSATVTWTAGNPAGTIFELERSTGGAFALVSASSLAAAHTSTGLFGSTTYHFRVRALNGNSAATAYSSSFTLTTLPATLPAAPSGFAGAVQTTTSVLWSWADNATDETGYRIIAGASNISGNLAANATTWLQTGLAINSSAGALFVQSFNSTGTANSGMATRYSLAAAPTGLAAASVHQTSATVTWTSGNPAETVFEVERSTGGAFALVSASSLAASFTNTGLAVTSTYYYRVRARNQESIATAYTSTVAVVTSQVPLPVVPTGFTATALSPTAIQWSWTDNTANETGYRVLTGTVNLSGDLAVNATTWLQTGLAVNTAYGPYAALAFNGGGTAVSTTASRTTLAAVPGAPTAAGVYQTSATLSWTAGGNPAGTTFRLERSTGTGFGLQFTGTATNYFDPFLTAAATHFYRVLAWNGEGIATAYAATTTVVALPPPPLPGAAGTPVGAALGTSSVSWTWVLAAGATNHNVFRPSDNSYLGSSSTGPFVQTALTPNTAYGLRVAGANAGGMGPLSPSASVYTLAAVPSGAAVTAAASTSVVVSWGLNGNAAATVAQLERSSDGVSYAALASGLVTSYTDAGLLGCTTYYYRVRNMNGDGLFSAYSAFSGVTANTTAGPPSGLSAAANAGGTIGLSWGLSGGEGVTGYRLYWDAGTGSVSYGVPIAVLTSTETGFTTGVLASSAAYTFALRTAHRCGLVETTGALAMSGAAAAPPPVRAVIKEPDSGRRISGNRITILGELISGTPSDVQQVLFQYKLATSTAWLDVGEANLNHENPDFSFPYFVHVDVTVLAAGAYDLRAVAYDRGGVPDAAPPAVRVIVDPVTPDISETVTGDGKIKKDQTVSNAVTSTIETAGAGASDPAVRVSLPPGVVTAATATLSVIANPTITTAAPSGQTFVGSSIKIDLSNGQTALNGTAAITLTYPDTVRFPSLLQIFYLNEATGQWSRDFATTVDTSCRTVRGLTPHFSTFALMLGTAFAADLNGVQVYPVPFKPNGTNPDEGRPFSTGDANSGIIFGNLAAGAEIKIYTLTGRLVSSIGNPSVAGTVRWDARNQDGRDVASGAYFAVITAAGHKAVVKKLVIIR